MRGQTASTVLSLLRVNIGDDPRPSVADDASMLALLVARQNELISRYAWDFLEDRWEQAVAAGQRFVPFPTQTAAAAEQIPLVVGINWDRPVVVEVFYIQYWQPVLKGITSKEYNFLNPNLGQTQDPIQRWRRASNVDETGNPDTFEVWPVPVTAQTIRFTGLRNALPVVVPDDVFDIDDQLLVYSVAADVLMMREKPQMTTLRLGQYHQRLQDLVSSYASSDRECFIGGRPNSSRNLIRTTPLVVVHG